MTRILELAGWLAAAVALHSVPAHGAEPGEADAASADVAAEGAAAESPAPAEAATPAEASPPSESASSSIVDALSADDDPTAKRAAELAAEEARKKAEREAKAAKASEVGGVPATPTEPAPEPDVEGDPVNRSPERAPPLDRKAPAIFQGGGVDPISGVKLGQSGLRQRAHIIISRRERAEGKHEISLSNPVQVNGKFTQHVGVALDYAFHAREAFAFTVGGSWLYYGVQSAFTEEELIPKAKQQPFTASALILKWEGHAGIEVSPIYGKFALFGSKVVQFGYYLGAAGGLGDTHVQLRAPDDAQNRPRTFGETGLRPIGLFSTGFRMFFGDHVAIRMELRDTIYSAEVSRINGCTKNDLVAIKSGGGSASCDADAFFSKDADGAIAQDLLKEPSSDILNTVAFVGAISVLF